MDRTNDARIRAAAFAWLADHVDRLGTDLGPHSLLRVGFQPDREQAPLLGPQGIFKARVMEGASASTAIVHRSPYYEPQCPSSPN